MPRPRKWRKVCSLPGSQRFGPLDGLVDGTTQIIMAVDEYETIRLIDIDGYTQEECAKQMNVARTTVQGIYNSARGKLADALVNGRMLLIEGGDYRLCDGLDESCGKGSCNQRRLRRGLAGNGAGNGRGNGRGNRRN